MSRIKTEQKTFAEHGLCYNCSWYGVIAGEGKELRHCSIFDRAMLIRRRIEYCDFHKPTGHMSLTQAQSLAWVLDNSKKKEAAGFAPPKPRKLEHYEKELEGVIPAEIEIIKKISGD